MAPTFTHAEIMRLIEQTPARTSACEPATSGWRCCRCRDPTERVLGLYLALKHRIVSNYLESPETATENLQEVKPTVFGADTEAWERLHARSPRSREAATRLQKAAYRWAIAAGGGGRR